MIYSRLYESMATWYRRWYSQESYVRLATATGLSLCMLFNLLFVLNIVALLGFTNWLVALRDVSYAPLGALALLWITNVWYAFVRGPQRHVRSSQVVTAKLALWYFLASFVTFVASFALLVIMVPPPHHRVHV